MRVSLPKRALAALLAGEDRAQRFATALSWSLVMLALAHAVTSLAVGWDMPLLDRHAFRQTHTALSARTIAEGGPIFGYETPVFGAPWAIPLEFPLYQLLVVAVHALGVPFDQSGRWVGSTFYLATLLPLWFLLRGLDVSTNARRLALAAFLVSPLYVYWSRSFLIESTVLFFCVSACALGLAELDHTPLRPARLALASGCAVAASMMKLMTAYGWLTMLSLFWLDRAWKQRHAWRAHARRMLVLASALFVAPLVCAVGWTKYSDRFKDANLLARDLLLASNQIEWNFGTWDQKIAPATWELLWHRTLDETLGNGGWLFVVAALAGVLLSSRALPTVAPLLGLLAIYATFTNLHVVHDYYQCATGLFLIVTVGVGLAALERAAGKRAWLLPILAGIALWQAVGSYEAGYRADQDHGYWKQIHEAALFIRDRAPPHSTMLIYGEDWSSVLPYYAERRALMNRWNYPLSDPRMQETLTRTNASGHPVASLVSCWNALPDPAAVAREALGGQVQCEGNNGCVLCTHAR